MDKLDELKEQRRLINEQIKMLECDSMVYGCAKLDTHRYPRGQEWYVAIKTLQPDHLAQSRWMPILTTKDRQKAVDTIDTVLTDLQELKNKLLGDK